MKKKEKIPGLRFPRFENAWEESILDNISERCTDKNIEMQYVDVLTNSATQGVVRQNDYFDKAIANQNNLGGYYIVYKDCFVYNPRISVSAPVGPIKRNHLETGIMSPLYTVFKLKNVNLDFIEFYFETIFWHNYMKSIANYGARHDRMNITNSDLFSMPIFLPTSPEQEKIASFLSAVDERIQQLSKKKSLLEQYKKGVMQQIFSQKVRFKEDKGNDFPNWEEKRLGEVGKFLSGTGFSDNEQGGNSGIPFYKVSDMNLSCNLIEMKKSNNYVTKDQIERLKYRVINDESIIFAKVGAAIFLERKRVAKTFLIDNNMMAYIPKGNIMFFYHLLSQIKLSKFAQVGALPSYNASDLSIIRIKLPELEEQEKIASFLSSIDKKIKLVNTQLEKTKSWKKGLLQKMFV